MIIMTAQDLGHPGGGKFGPDLHLLSKLYEIWSVDSQQNCCHQMSYLTAQMHQIQFRPGLLPRPRWGAYSYSPRSSSWI